MQRRTKIIATLGPSVATEEGVRTLIAAGMDVARLNFSHGDHDFHRTMHRWIRDAASELRRSVAIMQDIQGPKLRVGEFPEGAIQLEPDAVVELVPEGGHGGPNRIPVGYPALLDDVRTGDRVILADGMVSLQVEDRTETCLNARVLLGGVLADNKGVAFPDTNPGPGSTGTLTTRSSRSR